MGSDGIMQEAQRSKTVSIHAPTWGATEKYEKLGYILNVSIHAPTWGATPILDNLGLSSAVSIHAPTWGATDKTRCA